ncbi:hypothetical protein WHX55_14375 [Pseudomonas fluorescens]|uniref:hypothetical protein n=1 Tax=Pseudomonas fluorescens TaxID=294 RepID=UPI003247AECE
MPFPLHPIPVVHWLCKSIATDVQAGLTNTTHPGGKVSKKYRAIGLYREVGKRGPAASYTEFLMTDGRDRPETAPKDEPCPDVVIKHM